MWISDIPSIVFTRIKTEVTKELKTKYPNISFGTESNSSSEPYFPYCYVRQLQGPETGQTLENSEIEGILSSFQIEVTDNRNDVRAQEVANVVCRVMKSMGYSMIGEPVAMNQDDKTHKNVSRYRRNLGSLDVL